MPSPIRKIVSSSPKITLVMTAISAIAVLLVSAVAIYQSRVPRVTTINYSQLYQIAEAGSAASLSIESDTLTVQTRQGGAPGRCCSSRAPRG